MIRPWYISEHISENCVEVWYWKEAHEFVDSQVKKIWEISDESSCFEQQVKPEPVTWTWVEGITNKLNSIWDVGNNEEISSFGRKVR